MPGGGSRLESMLLTTFGSAGAADAELLVLVDDLPFEAAMPKAPCAESPAWSARNT